MLVLSVAKQQLEPIIWLVIKTISKAAILQQTNAHQLANCASSIITDGAESVSL